MPRAFPSGGIPQHVRSARVFSAWDATSPAFVVDTTLWHPDDFHRLYRGSRSTTRFPLLQGRWRPSIRAAVRRCAACFDPTVYESALLPGLGAGVLSRGRGPVGGSSGPGADRSYADGARERQRTSSWKTITSEPIPTRVMAFMKDLEYECWTSRAFRPRRVTTRWLRTSSRWPRFSKRPTWPTTTTCC